MTCGVRIQSRIIVGVNSCIASTQCGKSGNRNNITEHFFLRSNFIQIYSHWAMTNQGHNLKLPWSRWQTKHCDLLIYHWIFRDSRCSLKMESAFLLFKAHVYFLRGFGSWDDWINVISYLRFLDSSRHLFNSQIDENINLGRLLQFARFGFDFVTFPTFFTFFLIENNSQLQPDDWPLSSLVYFTRKENND
jgi:hypothetical protein